MIETVRLDPLQIEAAKVELLVDILSTQEATVWLLLEKLCADKEEKHRLLDLFTKKQTTSENKYFWIYINTKV